MLSHFSHVRLSVTPWTMARQAPLSMGFSRQEYWRGLPFPSPVIKYEVSEVRSLSRFLKLCYPKDCRLPGTSVHEIFQARVLEWVAISFSKIRTINRTNFHILPLKLSLPCLYFPLLQTYFLHMTV